MIDKVVEHIVTEMNSSSIFFSAGSNDSVEAAALYDLSGGGTQDIDNKVLFTVVNIGQDATYHSVDVYQKNDDGDNQIIRPKLQINIHFLLIANFKNYGQSLKALSHCIAFFQNRKSFEISCGKMSSRQKTQRVVVEMVSLAFEQQNNVWSMLGGKYLPSVMYKAGLVDIWDERIEGRVSTVREIGVDE